MLRFAETLLLFFVTTLGIVGVIPFEWAAAIVLALPLLTRAAVAMLPVDSERLGYGSSPGTAAVSRFVIPVAVLEGLGGMVAIAATAIRPGFGVVGVFLLAVCWLTLWIHRDGVRNLDARVARKRERAAFDRQQRETHRAGRGAVSGADEAGPGGELSAIPQLGTLSVPSPEP